MDAKGPIAKPEDVEDYLRNLGAKDWGASLDVAVMPSKRKAKVNRSAANDTEPEPRSSRSQTPPPKPEAEAEDPRGEAVRRRAPRRTDPRARPRDRREVGPQEPRRAEESPASCRWSRRSARRWSASSAGTRWSRSTAPHPVGRIPILVVAEGGAGATASAGCWSKPSSNGAASRAASIVEVTSNDRRAAAHAFYRHMGYERSSIRFFKKL